MRPPRGSELYKGGEGSTWGYYVKRKFKDDIKDIKQTLKKHEGYFKQILKELQK